MSSSPDTHNPDRYLSFRGIDFDGNMRAVLDHLRKHIDRPEKNNALWDRFRQRLEAAQSGQNAHADALLLLHSHVYYIAELFEDADDDEALAALHKLEVECF